MTEGNGPSTAALKRENPARPPTLNTSEALVGLYMLADYQRVTAKTGIPPQPGWFARHAVFTGINATNRGVVARAIAAGTCAFCPNPPTDNSTGDHILSVDAGGQADLENYIPCCRSCNSSKGNKDLLDWWYSKQRDTRLSPDLLVAYCRLAFKDTLRRRTHTAEAPEPLVQAVRELVDLLPTIHHIRALRERVTGVVGKRWQP